MRHDTVNTTHAVVVLPDAAHLRRTIGPTAWVVLEALLERAEPIGSDEYLAHHSIRVLASDLRLAKDTVARALRTLRNVGLISHAQCRTGTGAFDPGRYTISLPSGVLCTTPLTTPPPKRETQALIAADSAQLSIAFEG
jgi:hypothetical protein